MRKVTTIAIFLILSLNAYTTPQTPDILIVAQDTFYLHYSFPIEQLGLTITYNPFNKEGEYEIISSNCWRNYQAIWKIEDNKMYLEDMKSCHSDAPFDYSDVVDYFTKNGYNPRIDNGKILADWYTSYFVKVSEGYGFLDCDNCLESIDKPKEGQAYVYHIIKGELKEND